MSARDGRLSAVLTLAVCRRGGRGFSFDDLLAPAAYHGATVGELAEWMAQSRRNGLIEAVVSEPAERTLGRHFQVRVVDYPNQGTGGSGRLSTPLAVTISAPEPQ